MDARRRLNALGTGLLCLALLLGALDFHPAEGAHEPLALSFHPGAAHPGQPVHMEEADPVERPHCAACLHRLETRGACLEPVALDRPLDLAFRLCLAPAPGAKAGSRRPDGARAPPLS